MSVTRTVAQAKAPAAPPPPHEVTSTWLRPGATTATRPMHDAPDRHRQYATENGQCS